jgi:hypothetical protein
MWLADGSHVACCSQIKTADIGQVGRQRQSNHLIQISRKEKRVLYSCCNLKEDISTKISSADENKWETRSQ